MTQKVTSEEKLTAAASDSEAFGAARLAHILEANASESGKQSAFDCLELWASYPDRIEPLYAAALLLHQSGNAHLGLLVAEYATTMRLRPFGNTSWPLQDEAAGWQLDLLYARLLVLVGRVSEAMAHYGSVLSRCDLASRKQVAEEVSEVARQLPLCDVRIA